MELCIHKNLETNEGKDNWLGQEGRMESIKVDIIVSSDLSFGSRQRCLPGSQLSTVWALVASRGSWLRSFLH